MFEEQIGNSDWENILKIKMQIRERGIKEIRLTSKIKIKNKIH